MKESCASCWYKENGCGGYRLGMSGTYEEYACTTYKSVPIKYVDLGIGKDESPGDKWWGLFKRYNSDKRGETGE